MEDARPRAARLAVLACAFSAPVAVVLILLAAIGLIQPAAFVLTLAASLGGSALLAWLRLRERSGLIRSLEGMLEGESGHPPAAEDRLDDDLRTPMARLRRRLDELDRRAAAAEATLSALLDGLPDPVLTFDSGRRVTRANEAARDMLGRDPVGLDLAESLRDPGLLDAADAALAGEPARSVEFQFAAPVLREFRARVVRLAQAAADGAIGLLAIEDFTERRRIEQMRADFVANASHEIRTPLATLAGCVETLQGAARDDPEAQERFLAIMQQQAERMTRLVTDLLSLSRIELNEHTAPTGLVRLPDLLGRVVESLAQKAAAEGVEIAVEAASDLPPAVGDADELWQVFQNLIDNAIKYGAEGKRVEVACALAERGLPGTGRAALWVVVRDFGPGIPREHLPRLTERFYRVDTARSRQLGGTGLGLAIVKHIVNRHRGALTIESPGRGGVFTVYLPSAQPS